MPPCTPQPTQPTLLPCACRLTRLGRCPGPLQLRCSNAGTNAYRVGPLASQEHEDIISIVESNVIGVMLGENCMLLLVLPLGRKLGNVIFRCGEQRDQRDAG